MGKSREVSAAEIVQAIVDGDKDRAEELARDVIESEGDLLAAVDEGFVAGIRRVGELWEEGEFFLPELVQGAEAMKAAMALINPALSARHRHLSRKGKVVIGTVEGDLHDIGKSLVATMLSANGFEVYDLGSSVSVDSFLQKAAEIKADIIGASALLTTTMSKQRDLSRAIGESALPSRPVLLVGGAPTSPGWADEIGAFYAENALQAVSVARSLVE